MTSHHQRIRTSHAEIAVRERPGSGLPLLFIHGNSSSTEVFRHQMDGSLGTDNRLIAIDLPGHGESGDAFDPRRSYSMPAYAEATIEVLEALGIEHAIIFGWSLGGHVALEMLPRFAGALGLMIAGTPPVRPIPESVQEGFRPNPVVGLFGKERLNDDDVAAFADAAYGDAADLPLLRAVARTDGRARRMMMEAIFAGATADQRRIAETTAVPLAIVNGAEDPIVNVDYIGRLSYRSLWQQHCYLLRGQGHVPFLTAPERFNPILAEFARDVAALPLPLAAAAGLRSAAG